MSDPQARLARRIRLVRVTAGVIVTLIGIVFGVVGAVLTASRTWPSATGTVQSCTMVPVDDNTRTRQRCEVSWMDGELARSTTLDLDEGTYTTGAPVRLRYRGGTAVEDTPAWVGLGTLGLGLALVATGATMLLRAVRRPRAG